MTGAMDMVQHRPLFQRTVLQLPDVKIQFDLELFKMALKRKLKLI